MSDRPRFTVFIPVKNGKNYLAPCIDSLLAQTYPDFELVILGGFSTDGTCDWLKGQEARDGRIKVLLSDVELGIAGNWSRILALPKREFMTIVGYDDLLDPDFLEVMSSLIELEPGHDLYHAHFRLIDDEGRFIRNCRPMPAYETAADFVAARMDSIRDSFGTGYVMRSAAYDRVGGIPAYPDLLYADDALWVKLMQPKPKVTSHRVCFSYRFHGASVSASPNVQALFNALITYWRFLQELATRDESMAQVLQLYGQRHVSAVCQWFYDVLYRERSLPQDERVREVARIREFLGEAAADMRLDESLSHSAGRAKRRLKKIAGEMVHAWRSSFGRL